MAFPLRLVHSIRSANDSVPCSYSDKLNKPWGASMTILGWLVLGLIAGFIASKIVNKTGEGLVLDIVLGIVGAVVGGFLFSLVGAEPVTGLNLYSMIVAIVGAIVVLLIYHALIG